MPILNCTVALVWHENCQLQLQRLLCHEQVSSMKDILNESGALNGLHLIRAVMGDSLKIRAQLWNRYNTFGGVFVPANAHYCNGNGR